MPKVIFVVQRKADTTPEECSEQWAGEQHTSIVGTIPGLVGWVQNHVIAAPGEPVCDGVGELWFESDQAMQAALDSPEMAAAVDDAKQFLDMDKTGLIIVEEKTQYAGAAKTAALGHRLMEAWNSFDPERVVELLTDDHVYEDVTFGVINRGAAETRRFFQGAYGAFPDLHFTLTGPIVNAQPAAFEWTMTGTHNGDLPGLPATGKAFSVRGATVFEVDGDKIRAVRDYWDLATLLRQVGLMSAATT